ncbi:MAG: hypothetical protein ACE5JM_13940 [Armatimonadota bacterium]
MLALLLLAHASAAATAAADIDWQQLNVQGSWKPTPELVLIAETAVEQYPLAEHPDMWARLVGAYTVLARHAAESGDYARVKELVENYLAHEQDWAPYAPRNFLRAYYLEAISTLEGPQRAAEVFDTYHEAEGPDVWRWRGVERFLLVAAHALTRAARADDAQVAFTEAMVGNPKYLDYVSRAQWKYYNAIGDHERTLAAARLGFALCQYDEPHIRDWSQWVMRGFMGVLEPAKAQAFAAAQTDPDAPNPLADIPLPQVTDEAKELLLANAERDPMALVHANLLLGQWDEALQAAGRMLSDAAPHKVDQAIRMVAKCFKAKDLNLIRANQFIEYSRTGEGENPVTTF